MFVLKSLCQLSYNPIRIFKRHLSLEIFNSHTSAKFNNMLIWNSNQNKLVLNIEDVNGKTSQFSCKIKSVNVFEGFECVELKSIYIDSWQDTARITCEIKSKNKTKPLIFSTTLVNYKH